MIVSLDDLVKTLVSHLFNLQLLDNDEFCFECKIPLQTWSKHFIQYQQIGFAEILTLTYIPCPNAHFIVIMPVYILEYTLMHVDDILLFDIAF